MTRFLPKIYLDSISFLAGIVLVLFLFVLIFRYKARVKSFFHRLIQGLLNFRDSLSVSSDEDYSKLIYRYVQSLHITSDYFPLDIVSVPPKLIAPPPFILPGEKNLDSSLIQQSLGYDPLSPELSAEYFGPSFSLLEAISSNTNICLMGLPGTGKTTAIADCISSLVKGSNQDNSLSSKIPFYVKAHHVLTQFPNSNILEVLISALQANKIFLSIPNLPKYFSTIVNSGNAVLFIDDVDLLIPSDTNRIANFINALCRSIPTLQVVVTASPICLGNLVKAPLELISISPWGNSEKYTYLNKLAQIWPTILGPDQNQISEGADIRNSMLVVSGRFLTPLEFTLKSIAAFAGDITGPKPAHAIDGYLNRLFTNEINETLQTLEIIALHALEQHKSSFSLRDVNRWLSNIISASTTNLPDDKTASLNAVIQTSLDLNVLQKSGTDEYHFAYPTIGGFLASKGLARSGPQVIQGVLSQPDWSMMYETMRYFSTFNNIHPHLKQLLDDPSLFKTWIHRASLWLANAENNIPHELTLLKYITREIHTNPYYPIKLRLIISLAKSNNGNIKNIFQHLLKSEDLDTRRAAAVGAGLIQDLSAVPLLIRQLNDSFPSSTAACYALGNIGSPRSLEAIAEGLLHGNELLRRAAAESLAQNRSEGHPALREGISMDDLLVRYAVVHGLSLISEQWAMDILEKMQIDENEWVVRDLAQQAFEIHTTGSPYLPKHHPPAHLSSWLQKYASQQNIGDPTSENALDLLLGALDNGTDEQKQAAMTYLGRIGDEKIIPNLNKDLLNSNVPDIRQQAALTIWYCAPPGYKLPA